MASWYQRITEFLAGSEILAEEMNAELNRIESVMLNYLPSPRDDGEKGFSGPCAVGVPTKDYHAAQAGGLSTSNIYIDTGTENTYQLSTTPAPTAYKDGMIVTFKPLHNNTGPSTAQIGSLGNVPLKHADGTDLQSNDLDQNTYASFRYNGTEFRAVNLMAGDAAKITSDRQAAEAAKTGAETAQSNSEIARDEAKQWAIGEPSEPADHSSKYWANTTQGIVSTYPGHISGRIYEYVNSTQIMIRRGMKFHVQSNDGSIDRIFTVTDDIYVTADFDGPPWGNFLYLTAVTANLPQSGNISSSDCFKLAPLASPVYDSGRRGWYVENGDDRYIGLFPTEEEAYSAIFPFYFSKGTLEFDMVQTNGSMPYLYQVSCLQGQENIESVYLKNGVGKAQIRYYIHLGIGSRVAIKINGGPVVNSAPGIMYFNGFPSGLTNSIYGHIDVVAEHSGRYYVMLYSIVGSNTLTTYAQSITYAEGF